MFRTLSPLRPRRVPLAPGTASLLLFLLGACSRHGEGVGGGADPLETASAEFLLSSEAADGLSALEALVLDLRLVDADGNAGESLLAAPLRAELQGLAGHPRLIAGGSFPVGTYRGLRLELDPLGFRARDAFGAELALTVESTSLEAPFAAPLEVAADARLVLAVELDLDRSLSGDLAKGALKLEPRGTAAPVLLPASLDGFDVLLLDRDTGSRALSLAPFADGERTQRLDPMGAALTDAPLLFDRQGLAYDQVPFFYTLLVPGLTLLQAQAELRATGADSASLAGVGRDGKLTALAPESGGSQGVGALGTFDLEGLAFDEITRTLYGSDDGTDQLVRIDLARGAAVPLGPLGFTSVRGLAFDSAAGVLYGVDTDTASLLDIDPASGAARVIGSLGQPQVVGLAFDPVGGVLYGVDATKDQLLRIDRQRGRATAIGTLGFDDVQGLAFDAANGRLTGADAASGSLIAIDPATGKGTALPASSGLAAGAPRGLASFAPSALDCPASPEGCGLAVRCLELEDQDGGASALHPVALGGRIVGLTGTGFQLALRGVERGALFMDPILSRLSDPTTLAIQTDARTLFLSGDGRVVDARALAIGLDVEVRLASLAGPPFFAPRVNLRDTLPEASGRVLEVLADSLTMGLRAGDPLLRGGRVDSDATPVEVPIGAVPIVLATPDEPALRPEELRAGLDLSARGTLSGPSELPTLAAASLRVRPGRLLAADVSAAQSAAGSFDTTGGGFARGFGEGVVEGPTHVLLDARTRFRGEALDRSAFFALFDGLTAKQALEVDVDGLATGLDGEIRAFVVTSRVR